MYETLGTFIILYALIRIGWSMVWTLNNDQMIGWLLSPVGFLIGMGFLIGGGLIHQEYKNGIYLTMGVLVVSGLLSLAFHAEKNVRNESCHAGLGRYCNVHDLHLVFVFVPRNRWTSAPVGRWKHEVRLAPLNPANF